MYLEKMYQILPSKPYIILTFLIISMLMICVLLFFYYTTILKMKSFLNNYNKNKYSKEPFKNLFLSLFISFDPSTSINLFPMMNMLIMIIFPMILILTIFNSPSRLNCLYTKFILNISNQFEIAIKSKKDGAKFIFLCLFIFLMFSNSMGLIPNLFTSTSHMTTNLMISVPLWTGFFIFGWMKFTNKMFAHLVPNSTPSPLISFMVLIELTSTMIRPLTLSIRLMANMVSGHLLLTLLGNSMTLKSMMSTFFLVIIQSALTLLETAVSMIQAYVFCMLLVLYSDESDYSKN